MNTTLINNCIDSIVKEFVLKGITEFNNVFFSLLAYQSYFEKKGSDYLIPQLRLNVIKDFEIPLLTLEEQQEIVRLFDSFTHDLEKEIQQREKQAKAIKTQFIKGLYER